MAISWVCEVKHRAKIFHNMSYANRRFRDPRNRHDGRHCPTPSRLAIAEVLNPRLADSYALYLKTRNFHWHISGPHFRDYHLMLDEQAADMLGATDDMAERVRKIGGTTLPSIGHIAKLQRVIDDSDADFVPPLDLLHEMMEDNRKVAAAMRQAHEVADEYNDPAAASLLEN